MWELNFSEIPLVQMVRVLKPTPAGAEAESEIDLSEVLHHLDRLEDRSKIAAKFYNTQPVPLHVFGDAFRKNSFQALYYLASKSDLHINCCAGSPGDKSESLEVFKNASRVVLELSAIATLSLLKAEDILTSWIERPIVSQATITALEDMLRSEPPQDSERGYLGKEDGRYTLVEISPEDQRRQKERLRQLIDAIRSSCQIVPAYELAGLRPDLRNFLIGAFGQYGAESIALAAACGLVLWTDDQVLAATARTELKTRTGWTQVALRARN